MEAAARKESEENRLQREELFRKLDAGIRDMEQGDVMPHHESMRMICRELGLPDV